MLSRCAASCTCTVSSALTPLLAILEACPRVVGQFVQWGEGHQHRRWEKMGVETWVRDNRTNVEKFQKKGHKIDSEVRPEAQCQEDTPSPEAVICKRSGRWRGREEMGLMDGLMLMVLDGSSNPANPPTMALRRSLDCLNCLNFQTDCLPGIVRASPQRPPPHWPLFTETLLTAFDQACCLAVEPHLEPQPLWGHRCDCKVAGGCLKHCRVRACGRYRTPQNCCNSKATTSTIPPTTAVCPPPLLHLYVFLCSAVQPLVVR